MGHCTYNTNHFPCTYCEAPNPKHVDAKCRNEEELYCPLCGEKVFVEVYRDEWHTIECENPACLRPISYERSREKAIEKWRKYAR